MTRFPARALGTTALVAALLATAPSAGVPLAPPAPTRVAQAAAVRTLQLRDFYSLQEVSHPVSSPDGARIAYARSHPDRDKDAWVSEIWEIERSTGGERRLLADASAPGYAPDGSMLAFRRGGQLWVLPLTGGEPWQLTDLSEPVTDYAWAPDSRRLVIVARDERHEAPAVLPDDLRPSALAVGGTSAGVLPDEGEWVPATEQGADGAQQGTDSVGGEPGVDPDADVVGPDEEVRPLPRVVRRLQFKADGEGYLGPRHRHLHVVEVPEDGRGPGALRRLTRGPQDDVAPCWSPDGRWVVFVSKRVASPDATNNTDLWVVSPDGGEPARVTDSPGAEASPEFSPDGRWIAYAYTPEEPPVYASAHLRMIGLYGDTPPPDDAAESTEGLAPSAAVELTAALDRRLASPPIFGADGTAVYVTIEDRGSIPLIRVGTGLRPMGAERRGGIAGLFRRRPRADPEDRGTVAAILAGPRAVSEFALVPGEETRVAAVVSDGTEPPEIYESSLETLDGVQVPATDPSAHLQSTARPPAAALRRLSAANQVFREGLQLAQPEPIRFVSDPDVFIEGWVLRPPNATGAARLPLLVRIHGGPVWLYSWSFSFELQWLAAQGYAVLYVNPRGSSGYGVDFARALWADWGGPDLRDVLAGIDHLQERGLIDPDRIGVGGWSYGGILTNYMITRTHRFAAAISGASETDYLAAYGNDDLQQWWEQELGLPYDPAARELYARMSPIYQVTEVTTPTLFMGGEVDWRVPLSQGEEFYTQLRRRMEDGGPETALIVYPGQSHEVSRPSFIIDRYLRTKAWYDRHVLGDPDADPFFGERAW